MRWEMILLGIIIGVISYFLLGSYGLYGMGLGVLLILIGLIWKKRFNPYKSSFNEAAERNLRRRLGSTDLQRMRPIKT